MTDLTTVAELGTAGGTLVLAVATFASIRAGQRSARIAERSLLAGLRPVLFPTRFTDLPEKVTFADQHHIKVDGGRGVVDIADDGQVYLAMSVRNVGSGIGVLDRWCLLPDVEPGASNGPAPMADFRRLTRDIYVPAGDQTFWQGAIRDTGDPLIDRLRLAVEEGRRITVQLLYGDLEGGQRTISQFSFVPLENADGYMNVLSRHWFLDRAGPR